MRCLCSFLLLLCSFSVSAVTLETLVGTAPFSLTANASSVPSTSSAITAYEWYSSDGQTLIQSGDTLLASDFVPTFSTVYQAVGTYTLTLVVRYANGGSNSYVQQILVQAASGDGSSTNSVPKAVCTLSALTGTVPFTVTADASSSTASSGAEISSYFWQSSDGQSANSAQAEFTYSNPGQYSLTLVIKDANGLSSTAQCAATALAASSDSSSGTIPQALISASPTSGDAPLTVQFDASGSTAADGQEIVAYTWSTSDAQTADTSSAQFTFTHAGYYLVRLTVTDDQGLSHATSIGITANIPIIDDTQDSSAELNKAPYANCVLIPPLGEAPLTVLLDGRETSDSDGRVVQHLWRSSDGQSVTGALAALTFSKAGRYSISLQAQDNDLALGADTCALEVLSTESETEKLPPSARFNVTPFQGTAPLTVTLDASASYDIDGEIVSYEWLSTLGHERSGSPTTMNFSQPGSYRISLRVIDDQGLQGVYVQDLNVFSSVSDSSASNQSPQASFTVTPNTGTAPLTVNLDASASYDPDGAIVSYQWLSSYGHRSSGKTSSMTFTEPGLYSISLQVTDEDGGTGGAVRSLSVFDPNDSSTDDNTNTSTDTGSSDDVVTVSGSLATLSFSPSQSQYSVGDTLNLNLIEASPQTRAQIADLWLAVELSDGSLLYVNSNGEFTSEVAVFRDNVALTETQHSLFTLNLDASLIGQYSLYAIYTVSGHQPFEGSQYWLSGLAELAVQIQ